MMNFIKSNPIKLIFISLFLGFVTYRIVTAEPKGYCSSEHYSNVKNRYLSDEEFIKSWLSAKYLYELAGQEDHHGMNVEGDIEKAKKMAEIYFRDNPGCCKVYRDSVDGIEVHSSLWDRAFWRFQTIAIVILEYRGEGGYVVMSPCGRVLD